MTHTLSVRARILILIAAVFVPTVCAAVWGISRVYQRETAVAYDRLQGTTRAMALVVDRELASRAAIARTLAASPAIDRKELPAFYEEAKRAVAGSSDWVVLVDDHRQLIDTSDPYSSEPRPRDQAIPLVNDDHIVFSGLRVGSRTGKPVLAVYARVAESDGGTKYNVAVGFRPAVFQKLLGEQLLPAGGITSIVDTQQVVVARLPDPQRWIGHPTAPSFRDMVRAKPEGSTELETFDGVSAVAFYSTAPISGWVVTLAVPKETLTLGAHHVTLELALDTAVAGFFIILAGVWAVTTIGGPIQRVEVMARELAAEKIPKVVPTGLIETDHVAVVLRDAGERYQTINSELEHRVTDAVERATQAQTLLLQTQKHEAIGRLSGGVAHDFNNMLQTLSTALHVLGIVTTDERGIKMLDAANRAVGKAAQLVQQMLVFGRAQPLTPSVVAFSNFLIKSQELLGRALGNGILVDADIAADLRPLLVDETQLELALLNLAFNSRDAMPRGGRLTIEACNRDLEEGNEKRLPAGRYVEIRVVDSGEGVAADALEKIFEPYFTTKPVGKGSGLGLAQVQSFAQQSGGIVSIRSEVGRGTTVALLLPAAPPGSREIETSSVHDPLSRLELNVLFVEDDVLAASVVRHALEQLGHRVTHAGTAKDALTALSMSQFDVLFTDIVMPGDMSGLDLALKAKDEWPSMGIVVATGYAAQNVPRDQVTVIAKPYTIETVQQAFVTVRAAQQTEPEPDHEA